MNSSTALNFYQLNFHGDVRSENAFSRALANSLPKSLARSIDLPLAQVVLGKLNPELGEGELKVGDFRNGLLVNRRCVLASQLATGRPV